MSRRFARNSLGYPLFLLSVVLTFAPALAAPPTKAKSKGGMPPFPRIEQQYVATVGKDAGVIAVGDKITLTLATGKEVEDAEVIELTPGKDANTLKSLNVQVPKVNRKQFFPMGQITKIEKNNSAFDVLLDPEKKFHVLIDSKKRDADIDARLRSNRQRLWTDPTDADQEKAVAAHKKFLEEVGNSFPSPPIYAS